MVTPLDTAPATAESTVDDAPPPRERFAPTGRKIQPATQSMPAITPLHEPEPEQSSTRTCTRLTPFATPHVVPPTVPDTCVPWPLQSLVPLPSAMPAKPGSTRPVNSLCVPRM